METKVYRFRFSRRVLYWSLAHLLLFGLLAAALYLLYEGGYLSAWFTSCVAALFALMALSIPRKMVVDDQKFSIHCLLDMTEIPLEEIASVRCVPTEEMKGLVPLFGGCGFFGYYGHFLDLKHFERVRIYATEWNHFVEIVDIYDERVYVSCSDPEALVDELSNEATT